MSQKRVRKGFTTVELVIVIAVIAILATVLIPTFSNLITKANDSKALQEAKNAHTNYLIENGGTAPEYMLYQSGDRFVALHKGAPKGVYTTHKEALKAMLDDPDTAKDESATFTTVKIANNKLFDIIPNEKVVDLVMFMGQSNMAGRGKATEAPIVQEGHGYEFRAVSDPTKLYPIIEPFGENENRGVVTETTKSGSMVSAFVNAYYAARNVPIVAVSCSRGGKGTDFFAPDGNALNEAITRHNAAKKWLEENGYTIANDFMVWCQGETDGGRGMSADTYSANLKAIIEEMVAEAGVEFCAVVRIGNHRDDSELYDEIIAAQTELCKSYDKAVLVSAKLAGFAAEGKMQDVYHYTQAGYNEVGADAGKNTAAYINTGIEPSMYDPEYDNTYPFDDIPTESPVSQLEFVFDSAKENGIDLTTIATVENGVLKVTAKNESINGIKLANAITISPDQSFTIEFVTSSTTGGIVLGSGSSKGGFLYYTPIESTSKVRLRFADSNYQFDANIINKDDQKTHIAVVYDAAAKTLSIYQDGEAKKVDGNMANFGTITFTHLCGGYTNTNKTYYFTGDLHYLKYVDHALSVDQFHRE